MRYHEIRLTNAEGVRFHDRQLSGGDEFGDDIGRKMAGENLLVGVEGINDERFSRTVIGERAGTGRVAGVFLRRATVVDMAASCAIICA